jgi:Protein of unknown function (DUF2630)
MTDDSALDTINRLAAEEHELRAKEADGEATDADRTRIGELEIQLDQCWDLLRQRRARRSAGLDPDEAHLRDESTVEGYQQ